jgi:hypothetical protein
MPDKVNQRSADAGMPLQIALNFLDNAAGAH